MGHEAQPKKKKEGGLETADRPPAPNYKRKSRNENFEKIVAKCWCETRFWAEGGTCPERGEGHFSFLVEAATKGHFPEEGQRGGVM